MSSEPGGGPRLDGTGEDPLRVCFVTERFPPEPGGVAVAARRVAVDLADAGLDLTVVHAARCRNRPLEVHRERSAGIEVHRLEYPEWSSDSAVALLRLLRRLHEERRFDLFHGFFLTMVQPCTFVSERLADTIGRRPVIASVRGSDALISILLPYWRDMIREGLEKAAWVTSVNRYYLERLARDLDLDLAGRSSVIRNGVAAVAAELRWRLSESNRGVVGTVGVFRKVKDVPLLIRGFAGLPDGLGRSLLLAGYFEGAAEEERLWSETLIRELGLAGRVQITGRFPHERVGDHLRSMHVCVHTSAYEGLPNSLLEAAAHGVPLVATAVGGMEEVLADGDSGLLVPHGEPAALTAAVARVLADDDLARRLSAGALRLAGRLSPEAERAGWLAAYRRATAKGVSA